MKKIVIFHGWGASSQKWAEFEKLLKREGLDVFVPDLPGFGNGPKIEKPWKIDDYKNWAYKVLKEKGWDSFNILGHSFGGAIVAKYVADYPEKIENLILCSPAIIKVKSPKNIFLYLTAQTISIIFSLPFLKKFLPVIKQRAPFLGGKHYYFERGVMGKTLRGVSKEDYEDTLKRTKARTLIIWGENDDKISVKHAKIIQEKISGSKIIIFPSVKHSLYREAPKELAKEIIKFIE